MEGKQEEVLNRTWTIKADEELSIRLGDKYPANTPPRTVFQVLKSTVEKYGDAAAIHQKKNGEWKTWSWNQYYAEIMKAARALVAVGVKPAEGVNIIGFNSFEWFTVDLAAIAIGAIAAGIYTTNNSEACQYITEHSEARVVFVENEGQLKKFLAIRKNLPRLELIVQWSGTIPEDAKGFVISWDEFMKKADETDEEVVNKKIEELKPGKCCTLIYTSGTTGPPKAVMLSHDNLTWTASTVVDQLKFNNDDVVISYLPLSHIAAQIVDIYGSLLSGFQVYFAQPDALKGSLLTTLKEVRPTVFLGVPRVWEKFAEAMQEKGKQITGFKKKLSEWAKGVGLRASYAEQKNESYPWGFTVANQLIFKTIRQNIGFDRARFLATSAAPIARETLDYFMSLYLPIFEIFGMSESTGPETINLPGKHKTGTCGIPLWGTDLRILEPDANGNGEIVWSGRNVFMGYMKNEKETKEAIDAKGFLHSGDIGRVDEDNFMSITGRIKELIITAGGENVPPVLIEDEIKKHVEPLVSNVMVIGDKKKFLSCIFTLRAAANAESSPGGYPFRDDLAPPALAVCEQIGSPAKTVTEAMKCEIIKKFLTEGVTKANKRATSNAQVIQKFVIAPADFTLETNELTPTMKLKRRIVLQKYGDLIDGMYAEAETK